jgi:uncharacterized protein
MDETIKAIYNSWLNRKLPEILPRETKIDGYLNMEPRKIIVVTGFRRIGKTYLVLSGLESLLKEATREEIIYLNFDDERIPRRTEFLSALIPSLRSNMKSEIQFLILDEIQDMPEWSNWLRRINDTEDIRIVITGSSSKVSSREIPTELRGRCLEIKLFPLSFREFLKFKKIEITPEKIPNSDNEKVQLRRAMDEYIMFGGMPEVVLAQEDKKSEILQEYFRTVVQRDITERHRVKNEEGLKALLRLLLNSTQYSISKLHNTLKSMNYSIGKTTLQQYLSYIEQSYFMQSLEIFYPKVKDRLQYPRKVYFIDTGFINALSVRLSKNLGRLYENIVATELMRRAGNHQWGIHYWKDSQGKEVDFVVVRDLAASQLIQVCYDLEDLDTKKREIRSLLKAERELNCSNLLIITKDQEGIEKIKESMITFIPLWKWLLNND